MLELRRADAGVMLRCGGVRWSAPQCRTHRMQTGAGCTLAHRQSACALPGLRPYGGKRRIVLLKEELSAQTGYAADALFPHQ